jgi:predicted transcriptional regulator YdeE
MGTKLVNFSVKSFPKTRVIGKSVVQMLDVGIDDPVITDLWESMKQDGSLDFLINLPNRTTREADSVGWMGDFQPGTDRFTYLAGVLVVPDTPVPEGYVYRDIPACEMAVAWLQGTEGPDGGDLFANASDNMGKAMQAHGYEFDGTNGLFEIEYYSYERFRVPEKRGEQPLLDFYSPCKKADG